MTEIQKRVGWSHLLVSLVLAALLVGFGLTRVEWGELIQVFLTADYTLVFATIPLMWATIFLRGVRLGTLISIRDVSILRTAAEHNAWNAVMPFRLGELSLVILLKERFSLSYAESAKSLAVVRFFDLASLMLILLLAIYILDQRIDSSILIAKFENMTVLLGLLTGAFVVLSLFIRFSVFSIVCQCFSKVGIVKILKLAILTALIWGVLLLICYLSILSVGALNNESSVLGLAVVAFTGAALSFLLPISGFANVGTYHASWIAALTLCDVPLNQMVASAVVSHGMMLIGTFTVFLAALLLPRFPGKNK